MKRLKLEMFIMRLIVVIVVLLYSLKADAQLQKTTQANEFRWKSERSILYDMSTLFNVKQSGIQNGIHSKTWLPNSFNFYLGGSPTAGVAIIINGKAGISDLRNLSALIHPFRENSISNLQTTKNSNLKSIIIYLDPTTTTSCNCTQKFTHFIEAKWKGYGNKSVKIGVEVNEKFLDCCKSLHQFKYAYLLNDTVLRVNLTSSVPMLSYGLFLDAITEPFGKFKKFIQRFNSHSTLYIRPVGAGSENGTGEIIAAHYDALGLEYTKAWNGINENSTDKAIFIQRPSLSNFTFTGNSQFFKERATAAISLGKNSIFSQNECHQEQSSECWKILETMHSLFDNILLVNPFLQFVVGYHQFINEKPPHINKGKSGLKSMLFKSSVVSQGQLKEIINYLTSNKTVSNVHAVYIDCEYKGDYTKKLGLDRMPLKNIKIGCYRQVPQKHIFTDNITFLVRNVSDECGGRFPMATNLLLHVSVHIRAHDALMQLLLNLNTAKQTFEKMHSSKTLIPMIQITGLGRHSSSFTFTNKKSVHVSYCDKNITLMNEYYQAIITFARIYQWNELVFMFGADTRHDFVMWRNVETDGDINRTSTNFPLLFRSNSEKVMNGGHLPLTYPCINWTQNADRSGVNFLERKYAGATFTAKLRKSPMIPPEELQTVLHFARSRFPFVEITDVDEEELSQENSMMKQLGFNAVETPHGMAYSSMPLIYLQISFREAVNLGQEIKDLMAKNYSAVHLSDWEDVPIEELSNVMYLAEDPSNFSPKFGITVQNCSHEMNTGLIKIKSLPFISMVGYVVCNVKPTFSNNINKAVMQMYLDTMFYTKSYMEKILSSSEQRVEVLFRINLNSKCPDAPDVNRDNFLRFINDVSQHAEAYKIRYFIVNAFAREDLAVQCPNSWWRITNYYELTNKYVYVDRENEYIGRQAHPEKNIPSFEKNFTRQNEQSTAFDYKVYLLAVLPIAAVLFVVVLVSVLLLWLQRRHYENRFLTQKEVNEFYKPAQTSDDEIPLNDVDCPNSANIEFPSRYEISERDIEVQEEIGRGQFGVVHVGILKKQDRVAIKIPIEGCSKDEFMSALSELKILCYVASHPNIVSFLGAHTKNIRRGKLKILIEYCGRGALEEYLKSFDMENDSLDLNQFYGFAHQIAAGMEHLAEKRIIHGDLATRNILLTNDLTCKISDFGLSRRLYDMSVYVKRGSEALPWMWMALESLKDMEFTTKSDVWSYAVTLWEIFSLGQLPYPGRRLTQGFIMELESGIRMEKAQFASDAIHQKMLECWSLDQDDRPTFTELKQYFNALRNHHYQNTTFI